MAKVRLHDDPVRCDGTVTVGPQAYLGDDVFCEPPDVDVTAVLPTLEVRRRTFVEYDDEGNPTFDWASVVTGPALSEEKRTEIDDVAGLTRVVTVVTMFYDGDEEITESATVLRDTDLFRVTKSVVSGSILEMTLERVHDNDDD